MTPQPMYDSGRAFQEESPVAVPKVEIYTKWGCGFCVRAKALLEGKGVTFEEYDITMGGPKRAEMLERVPGAMTVPQIFIGGEAVGGCDDLYALDRAGKLDPMLAG
jgi:glutaredoxin 3